MTEPDPRPIARDDVPDPDGLREKIDALDEKAEAEVSRAEGYGGGGSEVEDEDVVPSHPAPEPPD